MTDKRDCPSRWQAFLNRVRKWLCRPGVLTKVISAAKLIWYLYDKLFGDDPWTFYVAIHRRLSCNTRHYGWCACSTT